MRAIDPRFQTNLRHGHAWEMRASGSTYISWATMKARCNNPNNHNYHHYGGRGIKVCKRWNKFENFLADMGPRPPGKTLDRIDNDKGYYKGNCKWATPLEQTRNRR